MITEADTCRKYVLPQLYDAGWTDDQISEQKYFTDGRIVPVGKGHIRKVGKRTDYLLRYHPDFHIAVVEAKAAYKKPGDGMQQAMEYAQILGLKFAYATNGYGIEEYDFITGRQTSLDVFPSPQELWHACVATRTWPTMPTPMTCFSPSTANCATPTARSNAPATTRRSPSTGRCRPSSRAGSGS